ncbi:MAG: ADP-ribosylglycohydrolase family protein [Myxococcaceae bacterium]|nr:ADP-ribosylglycohydrolase family protein [Myxococcaceae bacterium]
MLVEIALGDAYGAGFEYARPAIVARENTLAAFRAHPKQRIAAGTYTDDTQMCIAIAEAILSHRPFSRELIAECMVQAFKRDPREGYARGFYEVLLEVNDGSEFLARISPDSDKSGAAMRAGPIGLFPRLQDVIERTTLQARLTHDTPDGVNAAVAAALAVHFCAYELGAVSELGEFLTEYVPGQWSTPWQGKVGSKGWMSVRAAITALSRATSMSELLKDCIAFTGDVDTVAAIAMAAGSCCPGLEQDLPDHLYSTLENGEWGRDTLRELDRQLMEKVLRR